MIVAELEQLDSEGIGDGMGMGGSRRRRTSENGRIWERKNREGLAFMVVKCNG
jgi:hypothetical protein